MVLQEIKDLHYVIESYRLNNKSKTYYNYNCGDIEEIRANIKMFGLNNPGCIARIHKIYTFSGDTVEKMRKLERLCEKLNLGKISPKDLPGII